MSCTLHVDWDEQLTRYDFGAGHPMAPLRVKLITALLALVGSGRLTDRYFNDINVYGGPNAIRTA